jgi:hypothetical protein
VGSQNHNWGSRHTDHYAWGQVAGFDDDPDAFLELSTARVRVGPLISIGIFRLPIPGYPSRAISRRRRRVLCRCATTTRPGVTRPVSTVSWRPVD